jgi:PhoPQ-activated pathogenicity-related protein
MADTTLFDYVKEPDPAFGWKLISQSEEQGATVYNLEMTSQNWHGIEWKHRLHVIKPESTTRPDCALVLITGGSNREEEFNSTGSDVRVLARVAQATGSVAAVLAQVPNQPLYDDLVEDALIARTFVNFMMTGDTTWPLLFPMTKSAVRAMDAVQALAREKLGLTIDSFVVTGSSKRGWTTWLTAAADPRVKGIA